MKNTRKHGEIANPFFGLTDKGIKLRIKWGILIGMAVWLVLSGFTMILTLSSIQDKTYVLIVISMSLFKYVPVLMAIYFYSQNKAARYLADVYELPDKTIASQFLEKVVFGSSYEKITIKDGRIGEKDEKSSVILIGGPGNIQVNLGNEALLEKADGEPEIISPRNEPWKLDGFERIREVSQHDKADKHEYAIINSRDQFISELVVKSRTKDGIPLEARGIKVMFRLLRRGETRGIKSNGESISIYEKAVKALVYNQAAIIPPAVPSLGLPFPWNTTVRPLITSELENIITSHTLSEILVTVGKIDTANTESNNQVSTNINTEKTGQQTKFGGEVKFPLPNFESRSKITSQFFTTSFKARAAEIGISIEWIDVGAWQLPDSLILDKHKEAWELTRENAKKRVEVEHSDKRLKTKEVVALVNQVFNSFFKTTRTVSYSSKKNDEELDGDLITRVSFDEARKEFFEQEERKKNPSIVAKEILRAFRKELNAGKTLIENDNRPNEDKEKQQELAAIKNTLANITSLLPHYVGKV
jgi:hypothetical protein